VRSNETVAKSHVGGRFTYGIGFVILSWWICFIGGVLSELFRD